MMTDLILASDNGRDLVTAAIAELAADPALQSAHTRRTYAGALRDFDAWRAGRPVTRRLVEAYAAHLRDDLGLAPATVNHRLSAVRWLASRVGDAAAEASSLPAEVRREMTAQAERVTAVHNVKGDVEPRGRHVPDAEIKALLQHCIGDATPAGTRDAAMFALAWATGMRRSEILALTMDDLAPLGSDDLLLTIRHAKGNKRRELALYNGARRYLADWLALRGDAPGFVFLAIRKGGAIEAHGMTGQAAQLLLHKRAEAAGILGLDWHDFRRTFAGNQLDTGTDIALVQRLMGHASPVTTAGYDRRPAEAQRKALRGMHLPYLRKGAA